LSSMQHQLRSLIPKTATIASSIPPFKDHTVIRSTTVSTKDLENKPTPTNNNTISAGL
jgi:hypothetical protein